MTSISFLSSKVSDGDGADDNNHDYCDNDDDDDDGNGVDNNVYDY